MIDIIIPLGTGSPWQDNELRYALRGIEKHLTGYRNIYIVGEKPEFFQNVNSMPAGKDQYKIKSSEKNHNIIHVPYKETSLAAVREKNICYKLQFVCCNCRELTGNFLFFNDDHFLLRSIDGGNFPFFHGGTIADKLAGMNHNNPYIKTVTNTKRLLGPEAFNYDIHCPVLINKDSFLHINCKVDWTVPFGYLMKSIYCNGMQVKGEYLEDCKINSMLSKEDIHSLIDGRPFFSIGNAGLNEDMKEVLQELYPHPSAYELSK